MSQRDSKQLAAELRKRGYDVFIVRSGHYHVEKDGRFIISFSFSPGTNRFRNYVKTELRRRERELKEHRRET